MNITKLKILKAAAEAQSITQAAQTLHMTQAGASQQLRSLEAEVGFPLLIRKSNGIELTAEAKQILPTVLKILDNADELDALCETIRHQEKQLRLFYIGFVEQKIISRAIELIEPTDHFSVSLQHSSYRQSRAALLNGQCDVVIAEASEFLNDDVHIEKIQEVELTIIARKGTFAENEIELEELRKHNFLMLDKEAGQVVTEEVKHFLVDTLAWPKEKIVRCDSIESQLLLTESGMGITMMPYRGDTQNTFQTVTIKGHRYTQAISAIYKRYDRDVIRFIELCKQANSRI